MSRRQFLQAGAGAAAAMAAFGAGGPSAGAQPGRRPPNLLFVFGDEWRRQAVGFMGEDPVITPNIDRFAGRSMVFRQAISCYPVCSPYRGSLITGRYPLSTGVYLNCHSGTPQTYLRPEETSIADVLRERQYATGYIGKWHLAHPQEPYVEPPRGDGFVWDSNIPPGPERQGFDFWHAYNCYDMHMTPHYWEQGPDKIEVGKWGPEHETDVAIDFIQRQGRSNPFALFMSWNPPHMPFHLVPDRYKALYADKKPQELLTRPNVRLENVGARAETSVNDYFAAISGLDDQFGRLLSCLEQQGIAENTIVVLSADHGEMMGSHGRMHKGIWYEESIGVPFIIGCPGLVPTGSTDLLLNCVDVMPSLLGLMGQPVPDTVEGSDFSAAMRGQPCEEPNSALIQRIAQDPTGGWRGIRTPRHTYVVNRRGKAEESERILYDNEADPYQMKPVRSGQGQDPLMAELEGELRGWLERTRDPFKLG